MQAAEAFTASNCGMTFGRGHSIAICHGIAPYSGGCTAIHRALVGQRGRFDREARSRGPSMRPFYGLAGWPPCRGARKTPTSREHWTV